MMAAMIAMLAMLVLHGKSLDSVDSQIILFARVVSMPLKGDRWRLWPTKNCWRALIQGLGLFQFQTYQHCLLDCINSNRSARVAAGHCWLSALPM